MTAVMSQLKRLSTPHSPHSPSTYYHSSCKDHKMTKMPLFPKNTTRAIMEI